MVEVVVSYKMIAQQVMILIFTRLRGKWGRTWKKRFNLSGSSKAMMEFDFII